LPGVILKEPEEVLLRVLLILTRGGRPGEFCAMRLYLGAARPRRTVQYASGRRPLDFGALHQNSLRPGKGKMAASFPVCLPKVQPSILADRRISIASSNVRSSRLVRNDCGYRSR